MRPALLRDVLIIMFHSVTPPGIRETSTALHHPFLTMRRAMSDRVGVIRRLRLNLSLVRSGEDWIIDTTKQ